MEINEVFEMIDKHILFNKMSIIENAHDKMKVESHIGAITGLRLLKMRMKEKMGDE